MRFHIESSNVRLFGKLKRVVVWLKNIVVKQVPSLTGCCESED